MASAVMYATRTVSGNQPVMRRLPEAASQSYLSGVPVKVNAGYLIEWDATGPQSNNIAGIAKEAAQNLATNGTPDTLSYPPHPPNQPNAVNIPMGAPISDGKCAVEVAAQDSVFSGQVGPAQTVAATDLEVNYGLTKDTDGQWYVDKTKTGVNACVKIVGFNQFDTARGVFFVFLPAAAQAVA